MFTTDISMRAPTMTCSLPAVRRTGFALLLIAALLLGFEIFFSHFVPIDMDEFSAYHALACLVHPENYWNSFRESCSQYALKPPFFSQFLPLRSGVYEGSITGLFYYPIFTLWPSPYSATVLCAAMLGLQALLLNRVFGTRVLLGCVLLLAFMPYSFQHLTGLQSMMATSVFLVAWLAQMWIRRMHERRRTSSLWAATIGLIVFLGIWMRLNYLTIVPGILLSVWFMVSTARKQLSPGGFISTPFVSSQAWRIPCWMLFAARNLAGWPYYLVVTRASTVQTWGGFAKHLWQLLTLFGNPWFAARSFWQIAPELTLLGAAMWGIIGVTALCGCLLLRSHRRVWAFSLFHLGVFVLTLGFMALSMRIERMHHLVLAFPFLILALAPVLPALKAPGPRVGGRLHPGGSADLCAVPRRSGESARSSGQSPRPGPAQHCVESEIRSALCVHLRGLGHVLSEVAVWPPLGAGLVL